MPGSWLVPSTVGVTYLQRGMVRGQVRNVFLACLQALALHYDYVHMYIAHVRRTFRQSRPGQLDFFMMILNDDNNHTEYCKHESI